jgi:hypothetical protein
LKVRGVYKIGITSKSISERFKNEKIQVLYCSAEVGLDIAISVEQRIVEKFLKIQKRNIPLETIFFKKGDNSNGREYFGINVLKNPSSTIERMINWLQEKGNYGQEIHNVTYRKSGSKGFLDKVILG